jgi:hypothetical protein
METLTIGTPSFKNTAVESGTGTGKTYTLARIVYWFLDCFPNSLVITSAPTELQLKTNLWAEVSRIYNKIKSHHPTAQKWQMTLKMNSDVTKAITEEERIDIESNAWMAQGFRTGSHGDKDSEDKARGFHRRYMLIILEECTGIPPSIINAFKNTCTGNTNYILAVGNPNSETDPLHTFATQKGTRHIRASALDHPNIVNQREVYHGAVTQSSINDRTHDFGKNTPFWSAMVRGLAPSESADALIRGEWINKARNLHTTPKGHNAIGIDVANSVAGDKACTVFGTGNIVEELQIFQCTYPQSL